MMNPVGSKMAFGISMSELHACLNFDFKCMDTMRESFCMLRIGGIDCNSGTFHQDSCFKEYAKTCDELSIPWVGYIYLYYHTDNPHNKIPLPNYELKSIFDGIPLSLPYIIILFDFDLPNFTIERLDDTVQRFNTAISTNINKPYTVCVGLTGKCRGLAEHSEFTYPLYVETVVPDANTSISVPCNTILCWYLINSGECSGVPSYYYSAEIGDNKININQTTTKLDTVIALGEMVEAIHNYRGTE